MRDLDPNLLRKGPRDFTSVEQIGRLVVLSGVIGVGCHSLLAKFHEVVQKRFSMRKKAPMEMPVISCNTSVMERNISFSTFSRPLLFLLERSHMLQESMRQKSVGGRGTIKADMADDGTGGASSKWIVGTELMQILRTQKLQPWASLLNPILQLDMPAVPPVTTMTQKEMEEKRLDLAVILMDELFKKLFGE